MIPFSAVPEAQGLYDPSFESDSCGVAFVADLHGRVSHEIIAHALTALHNLDHRGAAGAEPSSGDGAGITVQVPDAFLRAVSGLDLPAAGAYAVGIAFLPREPEQAAQAVAIVEQTAADEGLHVLGWRDVPVQPDDLGPTARGVMPAFRQVFLSGAGGETGLALERLAFATRKVSERRAADAEIELYFPSLSARTLVYKGMLTTDQLGAVFPDLTDERFASGIGLVHSRFSTNTFPSWPLAHPYRYIAHNGEINTIRGNRNWMRTRQALLETDLIPGDLKRLFPICTPGVSDSATFDEVLELLHLGGRSLPHAVLMMIPEAWENNPGMDPARRAFYEFHASLMEPWDGPACVNFTDGTVIGAVLDRNGLRPGRWWQTADGLVVLGSETGVLDLDPATIVAKGRLQPGRMFLVDTARGEIVSDDDVKGELAAAHPYGEWLHAGLIALEELPEREHVVFSHESVTRRQQIFGYTEEELRVLITPMATAGLEPLGSMGTDTPLAALSQRPRLLFDYFSELFAQVTNPPLDAIREEMVTSLAGTIGPEQNLLAPGAASCRQIVIPRPVIDNDELAKIWHVNADGDLPGFDCKLIDARFRVHGGGEALAGALERVRRECSEAVSNGARILILSDRDCDSDHAPIPALLVTSAVHQHLIRTGQRTQVGLVVETGEAREVHHVALLVGYGAAAVNPYLAFETIDDLVATGAITGLAPEKAIANYVKALSKGVLKVMSKMGISTIGVLHRGPGVRGLRAGPAAGGRVLRRHPVAAGRGRPRGAGRGVRGPARQRLPAGAHRAGPPPPRRGRRVPVAPRGRGAPLQPRDGVPAPARHPAAPLRAVRRVHREDRGHQPGRRHPARAVRVPFRPRPGADRRGRAGLGHHDPLRHRRDVLRLDLGRGPRDPGHRHEPHRRAVQLRRGRRGRAPVHPRRER